MPLTQQQVDRQRSEGSLRRRFDYFVVHAEPETLEWLSAHWQEIEDMLNRRSILVHGRFCMRHGHVHADTGDQACEWQEGT
jgi:hypothetical protein